jgi:hypothetical protein
VLFDQGTPDPLRVYPKNAAENIPAHVLKEILREMKDVEK